MTYPQNWPALQAARNLWVPPESLAPAFDEFRGTRVAYTFCIQAFDLLSPVIETLDDEGVAIVLGAARMINRAQLDGRHDEALAFLIEHASRLAPPEE